MMAIAAGLAAGVAVAVIAAVVRCTRRCDDCGARFPAGGLGHYQGVTVCRDESGCVGRSPRSRWPGMPPPPAREPCPVHKVTTRTPPGPPRRR